jgi:polysaccharide export outer membrane protein
MRRYLFVLLAVVLFCRADMLFAQDYLVGEEDVLRVTVYDHPDLTTVARVSAEGVIRLPLIGDVNVTGLSVSQISEKVSRLLADGYIVNPHVSIFVEEFRSKKTIIMGQVNKPGIYALSGTTTFLELLSKAGGLTKDAGDKAIIKRKTSPGRPEKVITIDLRKLIEEGDTSADIPLMDNDNVYIAKAGVFYITGEVKKPDAYKYEEGTTVIKAVTMAGGFTDKASSGRVKLIRKVQGKEKVIEKAGMDEPVQVDDVIVVPESFF